jgi:hypothetical protein
MVVTVCIAAIAALAQLITLVLGYIVTVEPIAPTDRVKKRRYMYVFGISALLGCLAVIGGVIRSEKEQSKHDGEISKLNDTIKNQTDQITTLQAKRFNQLDASVEAGNKHISDSLGRPDLRGEPDYAVRTLQAGKKIVIDAVLHNGGFVDAMLLKLYYSIKVSGQSPNDGEDAFVVQQLQDDLAKRVADDQPSIPVVERVFANKPFTISMASDFPLTADQYSRIHNGAAALYVLIVFYYKSPTYLQNRLPTGHFIAEFCKYGSGDLRDLKDCRPTYNFGQDRYMKRL